MLENKKIQEIINHIHKKELSIKEVVQHYLNRIKKINPSLKLIITLPLILPPFLNISGYLAAIISLFILRFFSKEGLNSL